MYKKTVVYEDNQGTIALVRNPVCRQRCKHVDIKYHFIRSTIREDKMSLVYCPTDDMVTDVMTKPASRLKLRKCLVCKMLTFDYAIFVCFVHFIM